MVIAPEKKLIGTNLSAGLFMSDIRPDQGSLVLWQFWNRFKIGDIGMRLELRLRLVGVLDVQYSCAGTNPTR